MIDLFTFIIVECSQGSQNLDNKVNSIKLTSTSVPELEYKNTRSNKTSSNNNNRENGKRKFSTSSRGTKYSINLPFHASTVRVEFNNYDLMKAFILDYENSNFVKS